MQKNKYKTRHKATRSSAKQRRNKKDAGRRQPAECMAGEWLCDVWFW